MAVVNMCVSDNVGVRLKVLTPQPGDVIFALVPPGVDGAVVGETLAETLRKLNLKDQVIVLLAREGDLRSLSDADLAALGLRKDLAALGLARS